jgi:transketolase
MKITKNELQYLAHKLRLKVLKMINKAGSSHVGSAFSIAELLSVLYSEYLNISPENVKDDDRDRFIMSKGHAVAILYAILSEKKFFPEEWLETFYQNDTMLAGHATAKNIPGIELSTGSLGHGLSVGCGMAYAGKLDKKNYKVVVMLSDGECNEGSNWEAILFAAHHKLNNLLVIVDYNKIQSLGHTSDIMEIEPFADKWKMFNWNTIEVDGHNIDEIRSCFKQFDNEQNKPSVMIAHTVKGKGVSFMEDTVLWHYRTPKDEEYENAIKEINNLVNKI